MCVGQEGVGARWHGGYKETSADLPLYNMLDIGLASGSKPPCPPNYDPSVNGSWAKRHETRFAYRGSLAQLILIHHINRTSGFFTQPPFRIAIVNPSHCRIGCRIFCIPAQFCICSFRNCDRNSGCPLYRRPVVSPGYRNYMIHH